MKYLAMLLLPVLSHAATLHVPADYPTIQAGVTAAGAGDTVLVADGMYTGVGNYDIDLQGKALTVTSENGPDVCVLDAQALGRLFSIVTTSDTVVLAGFTLRNGTDADAGGAVYCLQSVVRLQDCRLEACTADWGGAVWLRHSTVEASNCVFIRCAAIHKGGAIHADTSVLSLATCRFDSNLVASYSGVAGGAVSIGSTAQASITDCQFLTNQCREFWDYGLQVGGAIGCDSASTVTIAGSTFDGNGRPLTSGGAIYCFHATLTLTACRFLSNGYAEDIVSPPLLKSTQQATSWPLSGQPNCGGALYLKNSASQISRCVFAYNGLLATTKRYGGAALIERGTTTFSGCTFVGNFGAKGLALMFDATTVAVDSSIFAYQPASTAAGELIELYDAIPSQLSLTCTNSFGNEGGDWVGIMDTLADKYHNFSADPRFCRQSEGNYHLQEDSPCRPEASPCGSLVGALPAEPGCLSCCVAPGNVNHSAIIDGGDFALLVAYLTNSAGSKPTLPCPDEANVNAAGIVDGSDLALLVAYLTNAPEQKPMLPFCP